MRKREYVRSEPRLKLKKTIVIKGLNMKKKVYIQIYIYTAGVVVLKIIISISDKIGEIILLNVTLSHISP